MNKKLWIMVSMIFLIALAASYVTGRVSAASGDQNSSGNSKQDLNARVGNLERKVADLQKQIQGLAARGAARVLTIPSTQVVPGFVLPPGAKQHEVSGLKYWTIPLKDGK